MTDEEKELEMERKGYRGKKGKKGGGRNSGGVESGIERDGEILVFRAKSIAR